MFSVQSLTKNRLNCEFLVIFYQGFFPLTSIPFISPRPKHVPPPTFKELITSTKTFLFSLVTSVKGLFSLADPPVVEDLKLQIISFKKNTQK